MIMELVHFQPQNLLIESLLKFRLHAAAIFRVQLNSIQLHNCTLWFNCTLKKAAACSQNISNDSMSRFWAWKRTNFNYDSQPPEIFSRIPLWYHSLQSSSPFNWIWSQRMWLHHNTKLHIVLPIHVGINFLWTYQCTEVHSHSNFH